MPCVAFNWRVMRSMKVTELPPLVYQLLVLSLKGHRGTVLAGVRTLFNQINEEVLRGSTEEEEDRWALNAGTVGKSVRRTGGHKQREPPKLYCASSMFVAVTHWTIKCFYELSTLMSLVISAGTIYSKTHWSLYTGLLYYAIMCLLFFNVLWYYYFYAMVHAKFFPPNPNLQ